MTFDISNKQIEYMTDDEVLAEAEELRLAITDAQGELCTSKATAKAEGKGDTQQYLVWLAGTRKYLMMLQARLARIRPRERRINIERFR